ncbi:GDP-L-fucose synthase family protein [Halobacteriovorax sp.]|uniref:GDP-L-fucose synthase family protein n=1 Tax=Halobacteriovorax sp. TaxID=2020862 RepID=UPI003AF28C0E
MNKTDKILVCGATGMVGSSIIRTLNQKGYNNILGPSRSELNLTNQNEVINYFTSNKPSVVIDAAAKVGGIQANNKYRADFIHTNLQIQNNLYEASFKSGCETFLFLGSSCIYPKKCPQPIKEEYLLTGPLEPTNEPYAIAKIAGLKTAESYRKQYGLNYFSVMPTNLYGVNDNFHPENSHVIPGIIQRMQSAIDNNDKTFELWGSGKVKREFLYVDDLAKACIFLLESKKEKPDWINVGTGEDIEILDVCKIIAQLMGFNGEIVTNTDYPDGTPRKLLDTGIINGLGWYPDTSLKEGLEKTIKFYRTDNQIRKI